MPSLWNASYQRNQKGQMLPTGNAFNPSLQLGHSLTLKLHLCCVVQVKRQAITQRSHDWVVFARQPDDPNWGHQGHAVYAIETLCRMVHTLRTGTLGRKARSAAWALTTLPEPWRQLVTRSARWKSDPTIDVSLNQRVQALLLRGAQQAEQGFPDLQ
jgi:Domain of unknown function (DUF4111)